MENNSPIHLQELVFGSSDPAVSRQISRLEKQGKIKKISPRIYSGKLQDEPADIIRRNLFFILGHQYPGAMLSHRSALEFKPTGAGHIFLTYSYTKNIQLPGVTLHFLNGPGPLEGDNKFTGELYVSGQARAFLENLQTSRKKGEASKTLSVYAIEEKLEQIIQVHGESKLNQLRDQAKQLAGMLHMDSEFKRLNKIISALMATHPYRIQSSPLAQARAFGFPYDSHRLRLFEQLFVGLRQREFSVRLDKNSTRASFRNFAFFEAYFSNYIEGTRFEVEEAKDIINTQIPLASRNEDSHDVLGTFQLVSDKTEMTTIPETANQLLEILQYRHRILLSARMNKKPGEFKDKDNYAGSTKFVETALVKGSLIKGFDYYQALIDPLSKAIFIMFMVSEVHPFLDGNGRIARVMMNAELTKAGRSKIIIPNVYRDDYIDALRKLTRTSDSDAFIRMMERAHLFSSNVYDESMNAMQLYLESCDAFKEHTEGNLKIIDRG
jgi:Fic family protein